MLEGQFDVEAATDDYASGAEQAIQQRAYDLVDEVLFFFELLEGIGIDRPPLALFTCAFDRVPILVAALLDLPPNRGINKTELAEHPGVTRQTVGNYTDLLLEVELIEEVPNMSSPRYQVADSDVVREFFELNSALKNVVNE